MHLQSRHGRKSGGGGGGGTGGRVPPPPPRLFRWGTQYQMSPPPPPPHVLGDRMNCGKYNVFFACFFNSFFGFFFFFFFFFFLLVRNVRDVGWVPLHILTCATFDADGAPEKKLSPPPPSPHQLFWDLRYLSGWRRSGKCVCPPPPPPPPTIRFEFAPLSPGGPMSGHSNRT